MIKNLIFDFGNVLLTLDEPKTWNAFKELLDPTKIDDLFKEVMDPFERGEISEEAFFNRLQRRSKVVLNGDVYIDAWNSMLGVFPHHRIIALSELREKYKVYLLSNTNITHFRFVSRRIQKQNGISNFAEVLFDKAFFSHEMQMRKPETRIYQQVLDVEKLIAKECLFIDDKKENVVAAESIGMNVYLHNPEQEIFNLLPSLLSKLNG